jgi:hypothetical protein
LLFQAVSNWNAYYATLNRALEQASSSIMTSLPSALDNVLKIGPSNSNTYSIEVDTTAVAVFVVPKVGLPGMLGVRDNRSDSQKMLISLFLDGSCF